MAVLDPPCATGVTKQTSTVSKAPEQSVKQHTGAERRADDVSSVKQLLPKPCHQHVDTSFLSFALFTETLCWEF
ncbi:g8797 [Coccomyxa viridis]|uniref:G8797 protein n=1 Tax=Coccomyxa viridis TaxID=1274662 RepID=A0ABP1G195_9CHLO